MTSNTDSAEQPAADESARREAFINAMRGVAHSVCVVTTDGDAGRGGATVSAFCSVSADPPTALVCLNSESHITEQVQDNGYFNINVLPDSAVEVSNRFAGLHDEEVEDRFDGIELSEWIASETSNTSMPVPVIAGSTVFRCQVQESVTAGTHQIIVGLVLDSLPLTMQPLAYLDGAYRKVTPLSREQNERKDD